MSHPNKSEADEGQAHKVKKMTAGAGSGVGRLEKIGIKPEKPSKESQE